MALVALGIAGCHGGVTLQQWATWPMPNSTAGLPNPQSFDVSDDVAADRVTGLMWQRKLVDNPKSFPDAGQACENLTLAGYGDWRLPSRIELVSILNLARVQPAVDPNVFPETPSDWFWTSSHAAGDPQAAWYVYFYFGYPNTDLGSNPFSWRCVRTALPHRVPSPRYDLQQDTVRDVATGLVWQRSVPDGLFTFDGAGTYCAQVRLGNLTGWRLPSMTELLTLVDETAPTPPAIDTNAFPETPTEGFWSGSEFGGEHGLAWQVYFDRGNGLYGLTSASFRVRCVL
ncbi:MAG: DUF1566 domain-containing protein [Myxococcales bacterium]